MDVSLFLAKLLGVTYLVIGLGILLNKTHYHTLFTNMMKDATAMFCGGISSLVIGLVIVMFHNNWVQNWTVIITIFGWLALAKGVVLLLSPKSMGDISAFWLKRMQLCGVIIVCLGLLLGYFGFIA